MCSGAIPVSAAAGMRTKGRNQPITTGTSTTEEINWWTGRTTPTRAAMPWNASFKG